MFKNATFFRMSDHAVDMDKAMESSPFKPCGPTEMLSVGWVPPRGASHDSLVETVSKYRVIKLAIETKSVPASEIKKAVDKTAEEVEKVTGVKPGKKLRNQLKDEALFGLLPHAFPKRKDVAILIAKDFVVIDTSSTTVAEQAVAALTGIGFSVKPVTTVLAPETYMKNCLLDEANAGAFFVGRACDMVATDGSGGKVSFKDHYLMSENVREHIAQGKAVTKLALDAGALAFDLTDALVMKKLQFDEMASQDAPEDVDDFDADVLIEASTLTATIDDLIKELGGLVKHEEAQEQAA